MPDYTPFFIADLVGGKITRRDPWLLPPDGFEELDNCNLKNGVLEKRRGRSLLGQVVAIDTDTLDPTLSTNPVMGVHNHLSGNTEELIVFDKERMNTFVSDKTTNITLLSVADLGGSPNQVRFTVASGHGILADEIDTITNWPTYNGTHRIEAVGATTVDIEHAFVAEAAPATARIDQEQFTDATKHKIRFDSTGQAWIAPTSGDVVRGVTSGATGTIDTVIVDYGSFGNSDAVGTVIFQKGTITGVFQDAEQLDNNANQGVEIIGDSKTAGTDDLWTGDNTHYFWIANWTLAGASRTYITNTKDPLQIYDGTNLTQYSIDIGLNSARTGDNDVTGAALVFIVKERVVIFSTTESGTDFNQRARWSGIKEPFSWPTSSFIDAPTEDFIVTGGFLGDDLYIWFEHSVWRFAWTGDSVAPFEWIRVSAQDGAIAQMSLTARNNIQRAVGPTKILANDENSIFAIDDKIPDVVLDWNPESAEFTQSVDSEEERQILFAYARPETTANADGNKYPDRALILNYEDSNWATFRHEIHTMGSSSLESDLTWDLDAAWEDIDFSWNASNSISGFPFTIIGDHAGKIFQINTGGSDDATAIEFNAKMARFNPYSAEGKLARLQKAEFLCDVDSGISFDVEFFLNSDSSKYSTTTITCDPVAGSDDKAWYTAFSGATGFFHTMNLTNNAKSNRPRIHAIRLWFKPAGRVK